MEVVVEDLSPSVPGPSSRADFVLPGFLEDLVWESVRNEESFPITAGLRMTEAVLRATESWVPGTRFHTRTPEETRALDERLRRADSGAQMLDRRLREVVHEHAGVVSDLQRLEVGVTREAGRRLVARIAEAALPDPADLAALDLLTRELRLAEEQERLVAELVKRNRAMETVLTQTKDIVASSPWFQVATSKLSQPEKKRIRFKEESEMKVFSLFDEPKEVQRATPVSFPTHSGEWKSLTSSIKKEEEAIPVGMSTLLVGAKESLAEAEQELLDTSEANKLPTSDVVVKGGQTEHLETSVEPNTSLHVEEEQSEEKTFWDTREEAIINLTKNVPSIDNNVSQDKNSDTFSQEGKQTEQLPKNDIQNLHIQTFQEVKINETVNHHDIQPQSMDLANIKEEIPQVSHDKNVEQSKIKNMEIHELQHHTQDLDGNLEKLIQCHFQNEQHETQEQATNLVPQPEYSIENHEASSVPHSEVITMNTSDQEDHLKKESDNNENK